MNLVPNEVKDAQVIFVSHSGGKDSQAMLAQLIRLGLKEKIVLVHADLGEMEWEEMKPWIESISFGLPVNVVEADLDFFSLARKYGRLPSGMQQFCTDFLKIKPIGKFIHDYMDKHGITKAINATGMRAEESKRRAGKAPLILSKGKGTTGLYMPKKHPTHLIHDWLPILGYTEKEVYQEIELAGQKVHEVYSKGFSRLSCVFCVNGRISEHKEASKLRPELARKVADLEKELGRAYRLKQSKGVKYPKYMDEYLPIFEKKVA
ncbi:MAG: phosphoadenosine phosphosulfate reductase family protein [Oligoflexia bacterium]|nr:phosphoadenosine phosphosulfate reductase family protein [Oligoflexia bacterium]